MGGKLERIGETLHEFLDHRRSSEGRAYERRCVRKILKVLGIDKDIDAEDEMALTFGWLRRAFPQIPIILCSSKVKKDEMIFDLFSPRSERAKLWKEWKESIDGFSKEESAIGLVFHGEFTAFSMDLILHNLSLPMNRNRTEAGVYFCDPKRGEARLESFAQFIEHLGETIRL